MYPPHLRMGLVKTLPNSLVAADFSFLLVLRPLCLCAPGKFHGPTSWQDWSDHWWRGCQAPRAHAVVRLGVRRPHWVQEPRCRDYERPHSPTAIPSQPPPAHAISVLGQQGRRRGKGRGGRGKEQAKRLLFAWGAGSQVGCS